MLRAALVLLIACDAGARQDVAPAVIEPPVVKPVVVATSKPPVASPVTTVPARAIPSLEGCWRHDASETWTFRREGTGLVVVREVGDVSYAARARIPRPVSYDPTSKTYGFGAAGRIHALMMLFQVDHDTLKTSVFSSHTPGSYGWTGNNYTLKRC